MKQSDHWDKYFENNKDTILPEMYTPVKKGSSAYLSRQKY